MSDEEVIQQLDQRWNRAYQERNLALLNEVLADDWVGLMSTHEAITKEVSLESQRQAPPPEEVESMFETGPGYLYGDTAVTTGQVMIKTAENFIQQRFTRIYAKRDGQWRAVAVQVVPLVATP